MDVGFIGLGVMGRPMAFNLLEAGHTLRIHRLRPVSQPLADAGAVPCPSPCAVAEGSEVVILMLPDTPDVEEVLFGADGVVDGLRPGALVIDMSSISPIATRGFAERVRERGGDYLDAPVSGGEVGARDGSLSIMVGGSEEAFARALPLFEVLGARTTRIGGTGDGQTAKVANQVVVGLTIAAVSEALVLARRAGADPAVVREALLGGFAASRVLEVHGARMLERAFEPGFRLRLHRKDLGLALEAATALGVALPGTAAAAQLMNAAVARGDADVDQSGLVRTLEALSGLDPEEVA